MKISLTTKDPLKISSDLLIMFVGVSWKEEIVSLGQEIITLVSDIALTENFTGLNKQHLFMDLSRHNIKKLLLYGVGEDKITNIFELQKIVSEAIDLASKSRRKKIVLKVFPDWLKHYPADELSKAVAEAALLSTYIFDKYKGKKHHLEKITLEELILITTPPKITTFEKGIKMAQIFASATNFARDLVNEPPQLTTPTYLAKVAQNLAKTHGLKVKILDKVQIEKLGMGNFLGVAKGSSEPPKFIVLRYKPRRKSKKLVLVGKGITFDTGGLSIKPSGSMETMKIDMAGAASILGVFSVISELKPDLEVVALIAACENMPSGHALHPGDILRSFNGKTVEIINTDAEGRLTLADSLAYAFKEEKADMIIDLATLTGAMMVALGSDITGFFTNEEKLADKLLKAAEGSGELIWRMPLYANYKENLKSEIADLRNSSKTRYGGAINAALFLEEFVEKTPWAHFDIAGPAFAEKNTPLYRHGATGVGVRLLLTLLTNF